MALVPAGIALLLIFLEIGLEPWLRSVLGPEGMANLAIVLYGFGVLSLMIGVIVDAMQQYEASYGPRSRDGCQRSDCCQPGSRRASRWQW